MGAAAVVDYSEPGWAGRVRELTGDRGVDVVFNGAGGRLDNATFEIVVPGGRFSAHGMSDSGFAGIGPGEAGLVPSKTVAGQPAKRNLAQLTVLVKTRLTRMQYRTGLLEGFLASTGLDLTPFCSPRDY